MSGKLQGWPLGSTVFQIFLKDLLDVLCSWIVTNYPLCRIQEFTSVIITLGNVNYVPECFPQLYQTVKPHINALEVNNLYTWLDIVWSLIVLDHADNSQIASVLDPNFMKKILNTSDNYANAVEKLKLLNINGVAKLKGDQYNGPLLDDEIKIPLSRTKEKQLIVQSVLDTMLTILPNSSCVRSDIDTGMGYLIDMECMISLKDSKLKFLPFPDEGSTEINGKRVALMVANYQDTCRGCHNELTGLSHLTSKLTAKIGYEVVLIPYTEFSPKEKLLSRVQYLEKKLKSTLIDT